MTNFTEYKISETEHHRITIKVWEDGDVSISQTTIDGFKAPTVSISLTKRELAKIAAKALPKPAAASKGGR